MFEAWLPLKTPLERFIWLRHIVKGGGAAWVWKTITGTAPLALANAVSHAFHSLTQYGLCAQEFTPTPSAPVDIVTNNGAIKVSRNLCDVVSANIVVGKYINNSGVETSDTANFYYATYIPVTPGATYTMATSSSIWYFSVMQYDSSKNFLRRTIWGATNTPVGTEKTFSVGADCAYIRFGSNMKKATVSESDVLAVNWMLTQTATAQDFRPYGEIYTGGTHPGKNLFNPASAWLTHMPIGFSNNSASWPNAEPETYPNSITYFMRVKPNTTYTYSCATAGDRFGVAGENSVVDPSDYTTASKLTFDSILVSLKSSSVGKTYTFTTGANTQMIAVYCALNTAPTNIQIEEGATATAYEAYTEIPYRPEVLTVSGVNLANMVADNIDVGKIIYETGAVANSPVNFVYSEYIPVEAGQNYVMYGRRRSDNVISAYNRICWYDESKGWISRATYTQGTIGSAVAPNNAAYARFTVAPYDSHPALTLDDVLAFDWTFAKASEEIPYQPYVAPQTVGWKNLFDKNNYTEINAYVNANTGVLTTGSPGSITQYCAVIPCEPNTQYNITGQGTSAWGAFTADSIGTTATAFTKGGNLTTGANDKYLIGLVRANGDVIDYRNTLIVRKTVTDIPTLLSVGDVKDEGKLISGIKTGKVGVVVFDGTEAWTRINYNNLNYYINDMAGINADTENQLLCTHFGVSARGTPAVGCVCVRSGRNGFLFTPLDQTIDTAVKFTAFLAGEYAGGTPVIMVYPLATETTEQGTAHALHTYDGTTIVSADTNVDPVTLEAVYASTQAFGFGNPNAGTEEENEGEGNE